MAEQAPMCKREKYSGLPSSHLILPSPSLLAHRAHDTVPFLERKVPDFVSPTLWSPNSPDLNSDGYSIWSEKHVESARCKNLASLTSDQTFGEILVEVCSREAEQLWSTSSCIGLGIRTFPPGRSPPDFSSQS